MEQSGMPMNSVNTVASETTRSIGTFDASSIMDKIKSSKDNLVEVGLYVGMGFLSGFLLKKYSTYVAVLVLLLVGLGLMHQFEVVNITINWDKVHDVFGIRVAQNVTVDNFFALAWEWVKVNLVISVSYVVGLAIGLKLG